MIVNRLYTLCLQIFFCLDFVDVASGTPELTTSEAARLKRASEAKTDEDDCEFTDCLLRDYQLAPPLEFKEIRKEDIGIRDQREIESVLDIVDLGVDPVGEDRIRGEVTVAAPPPLPGVMKLQLQCPGASVISSIPQAVRAVSSPAKAQAAGTLNDAEGASRDLANLPGPNPTSMAAGSSESAPAGTSSRSGADVVAANSEKQVVREEVPSGKRKAPLAPQVAQQSRADKRKKTNIAAVPSASMVTASRTYFTPLLDNLNNVLGNYARNLDRREVSDDALDDYVARHCLLVRDLLSP